MPELPAMENFRRSIEKHALNKKIKSVVIKRDRVVRFDEKELSKLAIGQSLQETARHGKYVFVRIGSKSKQSWLSFHCGMTGYFEFPESEDDQKKLAKAKLLLNFTDNTSMAFYDPRMFGRVELTQGPAEFIGEHKLGPDALDVTSSDFQELLEESGKPIKTLFLDQSIMAGIGNVYGDEIPFQAKINPNRKAKTLSKAEMARLYKSMIKTLDIAIKKKAYLDHWDMLPINWLVHYREAGKECPRCGHAVEAYKAGGRDGYWCPGCQK